MQILETSESLQHSFAPLIMALPEREVYARTDLLTPRFLLATEGALKVYYGPFHFNNPSAQIAIVGITPGWQQMEIAFRDTRRELLRGATIEEAVRQAALASSFAGSMRTNLIAMLNELGIPTALGIRSAEDLFGSENALLHTTSAFRYPVFANEQNYTGSNPSPLKSPLLMQYARTYLMPQLCELDHPLVVPLGKTVASVLRALVTDESLSSLSCLWGFPHPSGANGHRRAQFDANKAEMRTIVEANFRGDGQSGSCEPRHRHKIESLDGLGVESATSIC